MKRPLITLIFIGLSNLVLAQKTEDATTFQYSEFGLTDYIVIDVDSLSKEKLYAKTLNWVKETYRNPDLVLKMKIENEKLRIDAVATNLLKVRNNVSDLSYVIDISFKDKKYKFQIVSLLYNNSTDYRKIPNFKTDSKMIKNFGTTAVDIEKYFNDLNESLKAYVRGQSKKDDW